MAYAESTIGGSAGGSFRVWVNSIRTYDGSPAENYENWRCEGGINRVSTSGGPIYNNYNQATFLVQLGINGMAVSGNFNYSFSTATGGKVAWGTGTTTAYRDSAGNGFGFTSRTDVNLQNAPYLTSGWVQSSDGLITRYRHASLTALSMDSGGIPATDEGPMWLEFSNPGGAAVDAFIDAPSGRVYTSASGIGSRYNFDFTGGLPAALQASSPNSNTFNINIGVHDNVGGDNWDYRTRTVTIKNDTGQANPTFSNFTYLDTNSTTSTVTGDNQVLIRGRSTLSTTVSTANKATPNKYATMSSYTFLLGAYSQSAAYSSSSNVVQNMGTVSVTGSQNLSVRAVDSRGNSTTVTKPVTILPYGIPSFASSIAVQYSNGYDETGGLTVSNLASAFAAVSPLTLNGVNKNDVNTTTGLQFDISKGSNTSYSGSWSDITTSLASNGYVTTNLTTLASDILTRLNALGADNTVRWYIKFKLVDKLDTSYYETYIDIGRPIFRIGTDGILYHQEYPLSNPIVRSTATTSSLAINTQLQGTRRFTALATSLNIGVPTNPYDGQRIMYCIRDNGIPRALTWDPIFVPIGVSLPTGTVPNKWMYVGTVYNADAAAWHVIAVNMQA